MHIYFYYDLLSIVAFVIRIIVIAVDVGVFGDVHVHIIDSRNIWHDSGNQWHDRRIIILLWMWAPLQTCTRTP
jgi:hypothetical protein